MEPEAENGQYERGEEDEADCWQIHMSYAIWSYQASVSPFILRVECPGTGQRPAGARSAPKTRYRVARHGAPDRWLRLR
jgi:hypothetical protein